MITNSQEIEKPLKTDRRILRTRHALHSALMELIKEKDFDSISVEEISERAKIGRATFYLHYKDKEDLMLEEFRKIAEERVRVLSEIPYTVWKSNEENLDLINGNSTATPLLLLFEYAAENAELYRVLFRAKNSQKVVQQMRSIISQSIYEIIKKKMESETIIKNIDIPNELLAAYFSGAMISTINWWLEQELPYPPDEMARMFQYLILPGLIRVWSESP